MAVIASAEKPDTEAERPFDFMRDTFAFANELAWAYHFDAATGKTTFARRDPKPDYILRCFVLTRAVRQFQFHARFDPAAPVAPEDTYARLIRTVISRNPRVRATPDRVVIPGYADLREFSVKQERVLKRECGGAWRSYFLRSHWRMIWPYSRPHQEKTARSLVEAIKRGGAPVIHLLLFPKLSINHGMVLFATTEATGHVHFAAYDPNQPASPVTLSYDRGTRTFSLPANQYWAGGTLDVMEIFHRWWT